MATFRTLAALLLASLIVAVTLPAGATLPAVAHDGPVLVDASPDEHGDRCCLPEFGGHGLCHAVAALLDVTAPGTGAPVRDTHLATRTPLVTRPLPPDLKPPNFAG